jgi:long-chain acyl-CoA synthetase
LFTVSAAALLPTALKVLDQSNLSGLVVGSISEALPRLKSIAYRLFKRAEIAALPNDSRITPYARLIDNDGNFAAQPCDPVNDIAQLQYTGGTTGTPKGAMLSHQNITANARQINAIDPNSRFNKPDNAAEDRILGVLPFFHVFANATVLNRTVNNGGEIVMLPRFDAAQALAAINRTKLPPCPACRQCIRLCSIAPTLQKPILRPCAPAFQAEHRCPPS